MGFGKWARNTILAGLAALTIGCSNGEIMLTQTPVPKDTRPAITTTYKSPTPTAKQLLPSFTSTLRPSLTPTSVPPTATPTVTPDPFPPRVITQEDLDALHAYATELGLESCQRIVVNIEQGVTLDEISRWTNGCYDIERLSGNYNGNPGPYLLAADINRQLGRWQPGGEIDPDLIGTGVVELYLQPGIGGPWGYLEIIGTPTPLPATETPIPTNTPTPVQYLLSVLAFHDYNGNGKRDGGEPPLVGITNTTGNLLCTTGDDGRCELGRVPAGKYRLTVSDRRNVPDEERFRFIFLSSSVDPISTERGLNVNVYSDTNLEIALAQGPLVLSVRQSDLGNTKIMVYFDLDERNGYVRNYLGETNLPNIERQIPGTFDQHEGLDILIKGNQPVPVVAPISGVIEDNPGGECGNVVILYRGDGGPFNVNIGHLTSIQVRGGQRVARGDIIGWIDPNPELYHDGRIACTSWPHSHNGIYGQMPDGSWGWYDFYYSGLGYSGSRNFWTVFNHPHPAP